MKSPQLFYPFLPTSIFFQGISFGLTWGQGVHDRCKRFASIFDDNGDGLIELDELGSQAETAWQGKGKPAVMCCAVLHIQTWQTYVYCWLLLYMYVYIYVTIIHYTKYIWHVIIEYYRCISIVRLTMAPSKLLSYLLPHRSWYPILAMIDMSRREPGCTNLVALPPSGWFRDVPSFSEFQVCDLLPVHDCHGFLA